MVTIKNRLSRKLIFLGLKLSHHRWPQVVVVEAWQRVAARDGSDCCFNSLGRRGVLAEKGVAEVCEELKQFCPPPLQKKNEGVISTVAAYVRLS